MPKLSEMIESKYLKKEDVPGELVVTVVKIGQVNVAMEDQPKEIKWAARFVELTKPMVLNPTNLQLMALATGSEQSEDWVGKKVMLYVDHSVSFGGKLVGGIRIKAYREPTPIMQGTPQASAPKPAGHFTSLDDDIPF